MGNSRRVYYDHEPAYRSVAASGGHGWGDYCASADSYQALEAFLSSKLAPRPLPGVKALDLGCGGGQATLRLEEAGYEATGIDFSETAIELAKANALQAAAQACFRVEDCLTLGCFPDSTFDLLLDNHVFHCIIGADDRSRFLSAAYRVLKPGGIMFSETMSCEGDFEPATYDVDPATRIAQNRTRYWVSQSELRGEFEAQGFVTCSQMLVSAPEGSTLVTYAKKPPTC